MALKFDLYSNAGEGGNSTGVFTGGANPFRPSVNLTPTGIDLHSGDVFSAHLRYDGVVLGIILRDLTRPGVAYVGSSQIDLPTALGGNYAYVGFTAGSGMVSAVQDILTFTFTNPGQNVIYPLATVPASSSGPAVLPYYWPYLRYGFGSYMVATTVGDWVEYAVNLPWTGRYHVYIGSKPAHNRAIWQLSVTMATLVSRMMITLRASRSSKPMRAISSRLQVSTDSDSELLARTPVRAIFFWPSITSVSFPSNFERRALRSSSAILQWGVLVLAPGMLGSHRCNIRPSDLRQHLHRSPLGEFKAA